MVTEMLSNLIQTKLYIPRLKSRLVSRPRLLEKLDTLRERKLALISAPAGFGKTTLLSEWIENQENQPNPLEFAWLSLDPDDNDPVRFLTYFISTIQKLKGSFGEDVLPVLQAFQITSIKEIWEILASQFVAGACQFALVLDDYHAIEAPVIHEGIAFMLEKMPDCVHLVISTRADPPLPLSKLRARGELIELRGKDLRFTSQEIAEFLDLTIGKKLPTADQDELEARTEGWIAGLQLSALAIQSLEEEGADSQELMSAFIQRLSGSNRFIMDYLVEEVLQRLPEDMRGFLLETSILERLSAPLCEAVTGRKDSQLLLDALDKTNLFLFPLDDERGWYRYHLLFADLLRSFLQHDQPGMVAELHRRASAWYEGQDLTTEAIQHALKASDPDQAARLMEKVAVETLMRGEATTLQNWSALIADEQVRQRPFLCVCFVWAFLVSDKLERAEHYLTLVERGEDILAAASPDLEGSILAARSMLSFYKGEYEHVLQYAYQAREHLSPEQTYLRAGLAFNLGGALERTGEDQAAFESYQEARQISHAHGNRTVELSALKKLGDMQMRRGQLHQAAQSYRQALQVGSIGEGHLLPAAALTVSVTGQLYYEWDQLEEAEQYLLQGVELSRKLESAYALLANLQNLARVCWVRGDAESAVQIRRETEQILFDFPILPNVTALMAFQQVRDYLLMGDIQAAARLAQLYEQDWKYAPAASRELMAILWARLWIAQENAQQALEAVDFALPAARQAGRWGVVIELLVLQSLALDLERKVPQAINTLEEALRLAEPEGYARIFLDEGQPMARLLRMVYRAKEKGSREYETRLLERLLPAGAPPPISPETPANILADHLVLIDPLTERELEVLRMIMDGYSNQEIGDKLFITLGTVKAHVSTIYRKLDVRSRTQAIIKAKQLQLAKH